MPNSQLIAAVAEAIEAMTAYAKAQPDPMAGAMSAEFVKASDAFTRANAEGAKALSNATSDEEVTAIEQLLDQLGDEYARKVLRPPELEILRINIGAFDDDDPP